MIFMKQIYKIMINEGCYNCANCLNIPFIQHLLSVYTMLSSMLTTRNVKINERVSNFP